MTDMTPVPQPSSPEDTLRKVALLDYLLHIAGLLFSMGLLSIVAVIINYIKRDDASGTIYRSHMDWMISTFWWFLLWVVLSTVAAVLTAWILAPLMLIPALWFLYRMIKGLLRLVDGRPIP